MKHRFPRRPWRRRRSSRPFRPEPTRSQARRYINQLRDLLKLEATLEAQRPAADADRLRVLDMKIDALNEVVAHLEDEA
jgi:hypothetical protein